MNSFLKKVSLFNQNNPKTAFWLSCFVLTFTIASGFLLKLKQTETYEEWLQYRKEYLSTKQLQRAKRILESSPINPEDFIKLHLESSSLLTHIQHHHENSSHPSMPVAYKPQENQLIHNCHQQTLKGIKKLQFSLSYPVYMDEEDLKHLFSLTEEKTIFPFEIPQGIPFLFFSQFHLKKHALSLYENVFEIDYKLESLSL